MEEEKKPNFEFEIIKNFLSKAYEALDTPIELFVFFIFILVVLTSFLVARIGGLCGVIDNTKVSNEQNKNNNVIKSGAIVYLPNKTQVGSFLTSENGTCAIIESVSKDGKTAEINLLAETVGPINYFVSLIKRPPSGEVNVSTFSVVPTPSHAVSFREFMFDYIYIPFFFVLLGIGWLFLIGRKYEKLYFNWYKYQFIRSKYKTMLSKNKILMYELRTQWIEIEDVFREGEEEEWPNSLKNMQDIVEKVLFQLDLQGETIKERVSNLTIKDLENAEEFKFIYFNVSEILNYYENKSKSDAKNEENAEELKEQKKLAVKEIENIYKTYKESLIWLGLLNHK